MELDVDALPAGRGAGRARRSRRSRRCCIDLALVVADEVPGGRRSRRRCATGAGELLESLRLFDVYTGAPVPAGSRSLAYALTLRAPDRTLTGEEATAVRDAAVAAARRGDGGRAAWP